MSNTDWCLNKFDIQIQCILNIEYLEYISSQFASITEGSAATVQNLIYTKLMEPRQLLSFKSNGVEQIPPRAGVGGTVDAENGPKPQRCTILQLTGDTFLLSYHIIANYWMNYTGNERDINNPSNPVLFNRWSETVEMDECMMSRRIREGRYKIRSDNEQGATADQVRNNMAVLGVPTGFLRKQSKYTITPDGLGIQYYIVDQEVFKMPPIGAYEATGRTVLSTGLGMAVTYADVYVRLKGAKSKELSPQSKLAEFAVIIAMKKLAQVGSNNAGLIQKASITTNLYENVAEARFVGMCNNTKRRNQGITMGEAFTQNLIYTPITDDPATRSSPKYFSRGSACLLLQAAAYYDPNLTEENGGPVVLGAGDVSTDTSDSKLVSIAKSQLVPGNPVGTTGKNP